jgi:hypothetical protein
MRAATVVGLLVVSGCASRVPQFQTPPPFHFVPLMVDLALQPAKSAQLCAPEDESSNRSTTPWAIGPGYLYEQAKQKIAEGFDGALVTSSNVSYINTNVCVTVAGRPYRIERASSMLTRAPGTIAPGAVQMMAPNFGDEPGPR